MPILNRLDALVSRPTSSCRKRRRRAAPEEIERKPPNEMIRGSRMSTAGRWVGGGGAHPSQRKSISIQPTCFNLICAILLLTSNLLLIESDNLNPIQNQTTATTPSNGVGPNSLPFQQQATTSNSSSNSNPTNLSPSFAKSNPSSSSPPTPTPSSSTTSSQFVVQRRDLSAKLLQQKQLQPNAPVISLQKSVCQVNDGESVAIVEIEESRGSDMSQTTRPGELPISGSVALGEIELKIESETHKYFQMQDKSLRLTRPLDRDATLKENSSQILQQPITSIYLQISCVDRRQQQQVQPRKVIIPVLVKVLDLNDNAPKFSQPVYSVQVNELAPVGTVILDQIVYAVDLDSANNGQIEYSLLGAPMAAAAASQSSSSVASPSKLVAPPKPQLAPVTTKTTKSSNSSFNQRLIQRAQPQDMPTTRASTTTTTTTSQAPTSSEKPTVPSEQSVPEPVTRSSPVPPVVSESRLELEEESASPPSLQPRELETEQPELEHKQHQKNAPTINLNSEPILNGPMEETDEEESDEALLASMNANNDTTTGESDSDSAESSGSEQAEFASSRGFIKRLGLTKSAPRSAFKRLRRTRRHTQLLVSSSSPLVTTTTTTQSDGPMTTLNRRKQLQMTTTFPGSSTTTSTKTPQASQPEQPPWTNLMVLPTEDLESIDAAAQLALQRDVSSAQESQTQDLTSSNELFALELSPQTNKPILKLKQKLDYETKRVHQLTLVATDKAQKKHERLSSQVKIVVRVLDGDDQPPAFLLDQVGCATSSVPQATTPLPLVSADNLVFSSDASQVIELLQQEAMDQQQNLDVAASAKRNQQRATSKATPQLISVNGDLIAAANSQLKSFKVTDENFDFGDTLGLDDVPLDSSGSSENSAGGENQQQHESSSSSSQRSRRTRPPTEAANAQTRTTATSGSGLIDYLCLAQSSNSPIGNLSPDGQQLAEYYATVVSGDSDYLLRIAPQSIKARDRDELNTPIRYSFINGTPANYSHYFQINPLDASIKQVAPIERSQVNEFTLYIKAQEQSYNRLFSVAKLSIGVLPTDKNPPVLIPNSYSGQVEENSPIGTRVLVAGSGGQLSRPQQPNSTTQNYLRISVVDDADPRRRQAQAKLLASSPNGELAKAETSLSPPQQQTRPQSNQAHKQAQYEFETTSDAFKVDREGFVYVNKWPLDRDLPGLAVHMFQVTARQVGLVSARSVSSPISLNISLLDLNDNAPQLVNSTLGPLQMLSNGRGGVQKLVQVEALDRDLPENSQPHFSIQHVSNNGVARFRIEEESGRIEALGKFQAGEQFSLTVQVQDELGRSSQGIVDVQVVPGANTGPPQFLTEAGNLETMARSSSSSSASGQESPSGVSASRAYYSVEVNEGVPVGSSIMQVRAADPENDPITYSIIEGNTNQDFSINSRTGTLMVANKLDREEISAYKLIVQARDSGGLATSRPIHVLVTDSNDQNPIFNQGHYVFAVEEGVPSAGTQNGHLLGRVSAQDSDEGDNGQVVYSLILLDSSGSGAAASHAARQSQSQARAEQQREEEQKTFTIDERTGEIRLMTPLDYEQAKSHTLLVVARDAGENPRSSSAMVQVRVLDRQDELPYFERYHLEARLDENQPHAKVALVQARDPDSVAEITYLLMAGDSSLFQVDPQTGLVSTTGTGLDYEQARFHSLLIGTNESQSAKIDLADVTQRLSDVIAAKQTGLDTIQHHTQALERSPVVRVDVHVNDLNDNAPQFESSGQLMPVRVQDSVTLGTVLPVRLQAHDADGSAPNNQIRYELVTAASSESDQQQFTSEKCSQLFLVDATSGQISVRADLKRDSQSECQLVVRARDLPATPQGDMSEQAPNESQRQSLSSLVSLTVYIDHLAEISPSSMIGFADTGYTIELAENAPANTLVKLLPVINKPKVSFPVSCEILSGNELGRFYITENDQRDCELRTRDGLLDFEQRQRFSLVVKLNTIGSSTRSTTVAQLQINVLDRNDNRPVFNNQPARYQHLTQNRYLAAIAYDSPSETQLIQLRATDQDSAQANGLISYELLNEQELEGRFKVDPVDGILRTSRPIEDIPSTRLPIKLKVLARDNPEGQSQVGAEQPLESVAEVVVNLIDEHHRIALVLKDTPASRVLDNKEELLGVLQERTGLISGLERVESLKIQRNLTQIEPDLSGTDFWFYLIEPGTLRIVSSDDSRLKTTLFDTRAQNSLADIVSQNLGYSRARVRLPYSLTNALGANGFSSGPANLLFGAIRADSNERLAPFLILMALFIAVISAVVVVYQCGSVAGWSESTASRHYAGHNSNYLPPPHMTHHQFGKEKFLFAAPPPPPPSQYQFAGSNIGGTQTPQGSVSQRFSGHEQYAVPRASFNGDTQSGGRSFSDQNAAEDLASTQSKEYETQMLKMSVLFDDNQSYDERNLNDYGVNKNLV